MDAAGSGLQSKKWAARGAARRSPLRQDRRIETAPCLTCWSPPFCNHYLRPRRAVRSVHSEADRSGASACAAGNRAAAATHGIGWAHLHGPDLHFFAALSLVSLGMALLGTIAASTQRMQALGVIIYPLAAGMVLLYHFAGHGRAQSIDANVQLHAWLALVAYAALGVASLLAVMLWFQERALRRHDIRGWLRALPPLVQLEDLLFRSLAASFLLLTLALITGVVFIEDLLAQHLWHKTVLSVLSWIVLGTLLFGRWRFGWRGQRAVSLTLASMALLLLAYFGSMVVWN